MLATLRGQKVNAATPKIDCSVSLLAATHFLVNQLP